MQYTRAKGFDTFAPIGPCIATGIDYDASAGVGVEGWVNGERRQSSSTQRADLPDSTSWSRSSSSVMTLLPGDIISTGTPSGIGPLDAGDTRHDQVAGVGELTNPVAARLRHVDIQGRKSMKFFIDSGNLKEIEALVPLGIIDGITTNPSLLAKEKGRLPRDPEEDLPDREGPDQRRGRRDRRRRR